jgi:hypothetical protein
MSARRAKEWVGGGAADTRNRRDHRQMTQDNDTVHMRYTLFTSQAPALADVRRGKRLRGEPDRAVPASRAVAVHA